MAKLLRLPLRKKDKKEGQGKEIRYSIAGGKERLVFSNPADIELELAAAIEREESSVISGLSSAFVEGISAAIEFFYGLTVF